jgi:predicted metal-dependent phosphoesterase TrpH
MSDSIRVDLHVHSRYSPDSHQTLESIVARLPYVGLAGFALTDHNTVAGHAALADLRAKFPGYLFLPGVEVSTADGHVLALGTVELPPARRPVAETVEWVRAHGGEPVLAHPFRRAHGVGRRIAEMANVTGLEARNGHNSEIANLRAEEVAARRGLASTGGSDAHVPMDVGRAFTEFDPSVTTIDDLLEAIRRHSTGAVGKSLTWAGRVRQGLRAGLLRARRGFRPV